MRNTRIQGKILCVIPARGGSKGLKKKNTREFNGKPLIAWTIEEVKKAKLIDKIVVSTEDAEISAVSRSFGAEVIDRPIQLAQDNSTTSDVILYTLEHLKNDGYIPEYILLLQCTSPLREVKHIDEAIEEFLNKQDTVDSLISVAKQEHPPWWLNSINENGCLTDFMSYDKTNMARRQDFPEVFYINGAIYLIKTSKFYEYKGFQTPKTLSYVMDQVSSIDIDTELDFIIAEHLMKINKCKID